MAYKFKYFARPIDSNYKIEWEAVLIEFSLFVVCAVMARHGWINGSLLMAIPTGLVAVGCLGLTIYSICNSVSSKVATE